MDLLIPGPSIKYTLAICSYLAVIKVPDIEKYKNLTIILDLWVYNVWDILTPIFRFYPDNRFSQEKHHPWPMMALKFHNRVGTLVTLSNNNCTAQRNHPTQEFNNGVVMSAEPLQDNVPFEVRIDKKVGLEFYLFISF